MKRAILLSALLAAAACSSNETMGPSEDLAPSFASGPGGGGNATEVRIALTAPAGAPFAAAKGKAKFKTDGQREFQVEAENIPAGTNVRVYLGGVQVGGTLTANALRAVRLNLVGSAAPTSVAGKAVEVRLLSGRVVVRGSF